MFVSGSDDMSIKVWNYKQRRCIFTLLGHLDYLRTVQFHPGEQPWIVSCSDDQTVRIWNWQSRTCIAILSGHNHYVMSAMFHPKEDLVVSASLDQTIRVWDISSLRTGKAAAAQRTITSEFVAEATRLQADLFGGNTDAMVKFVLEGHERGINWASFHPNGPYIASAADDRTIKIWRFNEARAFETETYRGHANNVSCVVFHPRYDVLLSNSEDKTLKVWDLTKHTTIQSFRRESDRFWALCAHPKQQYLAAGHDSGLVVFKLAKERPAFTFVSSAGAQSQQIVYVANSVVRSYDLRTSRDNPLLNVKKASPSPIPVQPSSVSYSPVDQAALLCYSGEGGTYELYGSKSGEECKRGFALAAIFVGRNRFAVLEKTGKLTIKDCANVETKRLTPPFTCDRMFAANLPGMILLGNEEKLVLFNIQLTKVVAEVSIANVRSVVWDQTSGATAKAALICNNSITVVSGNLTILASVNETLRIKSASFDDNGVLLYNTVSHIKYLLPINNNVGIGGGESGIVRTIDVPIYITAIKGNRIYCLDRQFNFRTLSVNPAEYIFKLALAQKKYGDVLKMIQSDTLVGSAIIAYLQKQGYPEVALHFVRDHRIRFALALECGNIDAALVAANELNDEECWKQLGEAALQTGNIKVVEMSLQRKKDMSRLLFLYGITGNRDRLSRMLKIAAFNKDMQGRYHNALYLGDAAERVNVLVENGFYRLAYDSALAHGLITEAEKISSAHPEVLADPDLSDELVAAETSAPMLQSRLLVPPRKVSADSTSNWPLLRVARSWQETLSLSLDETSSSSSRLAAISVEEEEEEDTEQSGGWGDEKVSNIATVAALEINDDEGGWGEKEKEEEGDGEDAGGWGDEGGLDELDEALKNLPVGASSRTAKGKLAPVTQGQPLHTKWLKSRLPVDHLAAGFPESAFRLLSSQIGLCNPIPLKELATQHFLSSRCVLPSPFPLPSRIGLIERSACLPSLAQDDNPMPSLVDMLKGCYSLFTKGQFTEALVKFTELLHTIVFVFATGDNDLDELNELVNICREYVLGLQMELKRKELVSQKKEGFRQVELAAYFTHCNLQNPHLILALRSAANNAFQQKELATARSLATRLLELNPKPDVVQVAEKILRVSAEGSDADALRYNALNPFVICAAEFVPIYQGSKSIQCPYCRSHYLPSHANETCSVCRIARIGAEATGFVCN